VAALLGIRASGKRESYKASFMKAIVVVAPESVGRPRSCFSIKGPRSEWTRKSEQVLLPLGTHSAGGQLNRITVVGREHQASPL